jgi:hypothetical protein
VTHAEKCSQLGKVEAVFRLRVPVEGSRVTSLAEGRELYKRLARHGICASFEDGFMKMHPLTRVHCHDSSCRSISVLAFGIPFSEDRVTAQHGTESVRLFSPGALFCIVWWRQSKKRQHRTLTILEAPGARGEGEPVLDVHPAAIVHVFMDQYGPAGQERSIDQMLDLIQRVRKRGIEPAGVSARYWRRASRRILLGQEPPELAPEDFPNQEQSA